MKMFVKDKKKLIILVTLLFVFLLLVNNDRFITNQKSEFMDKNSPLKTSSSDVNGKPLLIHQYSTITNSFFPSSLPANVSFTLINDWTSQYVDILYEGVSLKKQRISNGGFAFNSLGWLYKSNNPTEYINQGWQSAKGNPSGSMEIKLDNGLKNKGDYGYYEQNVTIPEIPSSGLMSKLSMEFFVPTLLNYPKNVSLYLAIIIGNVEKNVTYNLQDYFISNTWVELSMNFDPSIFGEIESGNATIRVGIYTEAQTTINPFVLLGIDNIKLDLWTKPNEPNLVRVFDNEFGNNYTYTNTDFGKGYTFIDIERTRELTDNVIFTIFSNKSNVLDFFIYNITIHTSVVRSFNTTISGVEGSKYTFGEIITWETNIDFSEFYKYGEIWAEIIKPSDWNIIHIYDRDNIDRVGGCLDIGFGTNKTTIPIGIMTPSNIEHSWKIVANSKNYISKANMAYWNGISFEEVSRITIGDIFQIDVTLNSTLVISGTQLNCTINYPNGTTYWSASKIISSHNHKFGNFTAGNNMTVGTYQVIVEWVNNQSHLFNDKTGFKAFNFKVWHHTNLTAIDSDIEIIAGDPLLIKVKYMDFDFNSAIEFANVNYSSTFGQYSSMVYIGSGIYFSEIDTSSLELGDYYFSFSASKLFYENQTINNLIHLKVIPQSLEIELSHHVIETSANTIVSCRINVRGAITKTLLWPANISTDWFNSYNITDHNNGTYTIDFSTEDIPTQGYLESYTIEIFANMTNYGNTNDFLTLLVHPIPTIAYANTSLISVYQGDTVQIRANYTDENSGELIPGANCTVLWQGSYLITPVLNQFDITLDTTGMSVDYYSVLITFKRAAYETAFKSLIVIINNKEVNFSVCIDSVPIFENSLIEACFQQQINISARVRTILGGTYLSGGIITLISNNYKVNLTESPSTYFTKSIVLDGMYFDSGVNTIFLRFEQTSYSTRIFAFQLYIRAQNIDLTTQINYQNVPENYLLEIFYNQVFHLSCRAYAEIDAKFLSGGIITFINGENELELTESMDYWYNLSITINSSLFSIGPNYVYLRFEQSNYTTTTFSLQIFVKQIEFHVTPIGFDNIIYGNAGDQITIRLNITGQGAKNYIENATVSYNWKYNSDFFNELGNGIYELKLKLPVEGSGTYQIRVLVSKEDIIYKTTEFSFIIGIYRLESPNFLPLVIIIGLVVLAGVLGTLSLRSYVILPRKRKREAELIDKIQVYKDVNNIQALMLIQKESGLPIYTQEIGIFESDDDSFMVAGFIQAITSFSDVVIKKEFNKYKDTESRSEYSKYIIELDFNIFQLLVCDYETLRILLFLREKSSERLKQHLYLLVKALTSQYGEKFITFVGNLSYIKNDLTSVINQFLFLHYAKNFNVNEDKDYVDAIINSSELKKMEVRLFNVILSITKQKKEFKLQDPIDQIHEKNKDIVLEALDTLIKKKLIISPYSVGIKPKK